MTDEMIDNVVQRFVHSAEQGDFRLRRMEADDLHAILEIEGYSFSDPWSGESFMGEIENRSGASYAFVCELDGMIAGYLCLWKIVDEVHITNIAIDADFRKTGLGSALIGFVKDFCVAADCGYITLEVRMSNIAARKLYERAGFFYAGVRKNYYRNCSEDGLIMTIDMSVEG